jgi:hypothetical protein
MKPISLKYIVGVAILILLFSCNKPYLKGTIRIKGKFKSQIDSTIIPKGNFYLLSTSTPISQKVRTLNIMDSVLNCIDALGNFDVSFNIGEPNLRMFIVLDSTKINTNQLFSDKSYSKFNYVKELSAYETVLDFYY